MRKAGSDFGVVDGSGRRSGAVIEPGVWPRPDSHRPGVVGPLLEERAFLERWLQQWPRLTQNGPEGSYNRFLLSKTERSCLDHQ